MKFNLISRLVLALLVFSGGSQLTLAGTPLPAKTAQITLEGTLPPNCFVKINNGEGYTLSMTSKDGKISPAISVASHCNRTSTHTLEISYDHPNADSAKGELWRVEQGSTDSKPILYGIKTAKGDILAPTNPLKSQGRDIKESIQVDFETDNRTAGTYYGAVTITLKDA